MSLDGQRVDPTRYSLIPRTLTFLVRGNQVLLIQLGAKHAGWNGLYNGLGGHIEQGEDPRSAAVREVLEESGLEVADQRLCGVVTVDTQSNPGIGLYVFVGELDRERADPGMDNLAWHSIDELGNVPLVEDLPTLLPAALKAYRERSTFSACYTYSSSGELRIQFS